MKVIITGARGSMARELRGLWQEKRPADELILLNREDNESLAAELPRADALVDFSGPGALDPILAFARRTGTPLVMATTGYSEDARGRLKACGKEVPVFYSANYSLGIYVLKQLARLAAEYLPEADIEVVEMHHNRKKDAPSGTAHLLVEVLEEVRGDQGRSYGRQGHQPRIPGEIGIHTVRGGTVTGEHTILFALENERLELVHRGESQRLFAAGALKAAVFMAGKPPGWYDMDDLMKGDL